MNDFFYSPNTKIQKNDCDQENSIFGGREGLAFGSAENNTSHYRKVRNQIHGLQGVQRAVLLYQMRQAVDGFNRHT